MHSQKIGGKQRQLMCNLLRKENRGRWPDEKIQMATVTNHVIIIVE